MDILINDELLHLTAGILKTLSYPGGNVLLIGRSGIGRKSAVKITSALQTAKLITLEHDELQFNNDLKAVSIQIFKRFWNYVLTTIFKCTGCILSPRCKLK